MAANKKQQQQEEERMRSAPEHKRGHRYLKLVMRMPQATLFPVLSNTFHSGGDVWFDHEGLPPFRFLICREERGSLHVF